MCTPDFFVAMANAAGANINMNSGASTAADYGAPAGGLIQPNANPTGTTAPAQVSVAPLGTGPTYGLTGTSPSAQLQQNSPIEQAGIWYQNASKAADQKAAQDPQQYYSNPVLQQEFPNQYTPQQQQQSNQAQQTQQPNSIDGTGTTNPFDPTQQQNRRTNLQGAMDPYYGNVMGNAPGGGT